MKEMFYKGDSKERVGDRIPICIRRDIPFVGHTDVHLRQFHQEASNKTSSYLLLCNHNIFS